MTITYKIIIITSPHLHYSENITFTQTSTQQQIHPANSYTTTFIPKLPKTHHHTAPPTYIITEETIKIPEAGSTTAAPVSIAGVGATASCAPTGDPITNTRNTIATATFPKAELIEVIVPECSTEWSTERHVRRSEM